MMVTRVLRKSVASYPPFTAATHARSPVVPPRELLPRLQHPPSSPAPPGHPPRPQFRAPPQGYERSVHAAPAAWPKTLREASGTLSRQSHPFAQAPPGVKETKEERNTRLVAEKDQCIAQRAGADHWKLDDAVEAAQNGQWMVAERWKRQQPVDGGLTLVLTHACGLQREQWHPTLHSLLARAADAPGSTYGDGSPLSKPTSVAINDIWLLDDTHHGASVDLNAGRLGPVHSWSDTARDVLNFVEHVLPSIADKTTLPWQLPWGEEGTREPSKVIGVGHSYGANALVQAAHARPDLFSSLFLVEPMAPPLMINAPKKGYPLTLGAIKRRSHWPSRAAAAESVRGNPMFKTWNEDVFQLWLDHSLVPSDPSQPDGAVELATPSWAEAAVFSDPHSTLRGWDQLQELDLPTGLLMAGDEFWMCGEEIANEMVWRPKRARNERLLEATHLIIQEKPHATAEALWRFLTTLDAGDWDATKAPL